MGYIWQGNFKYYFGLDCIRRFASDLLELETENNFKRNKQMIFNEEDKLYHETNNTCHICSKTYINKVRDHCHETGKYRGPACKICNLKYKQQNIPLAAGKSKMFSIGFLKFLDSYNFLAMPLDQKARTYVCKTKILYPYEYFGLDTYQEVIGNLNIENFKSSLSNRLPTQEEVESFNKDNSHKAGKDLTIDYLQNDVKLLDYSMNEYVKLSMKEFGLNPLHYVSLPGYSFAGWLTSSGVSLDTLQDKQMLDDFVETKRGGICGIMGDRIVNNSNGSKMAKYRRSRFTDDHRSIREPASQIWYIDANNL